MSLKVKGPTDYMPKLGMSYSDYICNDNIFSIIVLKYLPELAVEVVQFIDSRDLSYG